MVNDVILINWWIWAKLWNESIHIWYIYAFMFTDISCKYRQHKCRREPAPHPNRGSVPSSSPHRVEHRSTITDGSIRMPILINTWTEYSWIISISHIWFFLFNVGWKQAKKHYNVSVFRNALYIHGHTFFVVY